MTVRPLARCALLVLLASAASAQAPGDTLHAVRMGVARPAGPSVSGGLDYRTSDPFVFVRHEGTDLLLVEHPETDLEYTVSASAFGVTPVPRERRYVHGTVNVRSGPGTQHAEIDELERGEVVYVRECERGWCLVEPALRAAWETAYVAESLLRSSAPADRATAPRSSSRSSGRARSAPNYRVTRSSVQCSGTTQRGRRCRRMTRSANGRCYQHGG